MKLSVVIPARNEAGNIGPTIDGICQRLRREQIPYEIVVVDDGSSDDTPAEIRARAQVDEGIRLIHNEGAHGFGMAVRCGLDAFTGDAVAIMMADGSDSPDDLVKYYYVLRDRAECAFGSRFIPGGAVVGYPRYKLVVNRIANWFVRVLFGMRFNDVTNAFKGYRAHVIAGCRPLLSPHFNLTVELPLKAVVRGYSYETVPITWRQRKIGISSLKLQEMGSRYLFIVLIVFLERLLSRGDYRRRDGGTPPVSARPDDGTTRMVAGPEAF